MSAEKNSARRISVPLSGVDELTRSLMSTVEDVDDKAFVNGAMEHEFNLHDESMLAQSQQLSQRQKRNIRAAVKRQREEMEQHDRVLEKLRPRPKRPTRKRMDLFELCCEPNSGLSQAVIDRGGTAMRIGLPDWNLLDEKQEKEVM